MLFMWKGVSLKTRLPPAPAMFSPHHAEVAHDFSGCRVYGSQKHPYSGLRIWGLRRTGLRFRVWGLLVGVVCWQVPQGLAPQPTAKLTATTTTTKAAATSPFPCVPSLFHHIHHRHHCKLFTISSRRDCIIGYLPSTDIATTGLHCLLNPPVACSGLVACSCATGRGFIHAKLLAGAIFSRHFLVEKTQKYEWGRHFVHMAIFTREARACTPKG